MAPYRPPGRGNRSGRTNADNDVFEGLPVKQWGQSFARISLAPPVSEIINGEDDKWGEPPMPRDYQLLQPWTQQLLRLARSGKVGMKRKPDPESLDEDKPEDENVEELRASLEDRGYVAKKWKPVPEAALEPEHKHFEFLAKRRKGLPSLYGPSLHSAAAIPMRKTKVQKAGADGEVAVYEVLVPEGQTIEGEVTESTELASTAPIAAPAPGTLIEGVGIVNEEGVVVAEHLKPPVVHRRNRPPPKKKGGPGRGKKRVTFTNPDGSTYTTIVPNATKIIPRPGQTVKHVAKGEEATADVSAEQVQKHPEVAEQAEGEGEGEGEGEAEGEVEGEGEGEGEEGDDDDDGDDGDDDEDREEGELSDEDASMESATPVQSKQSGGDAPHTTSEPAVTATEANPPAPTSESAPDDASRVRDASSSPELPLAKSSHSRQSSLAQLPKANPPASEHPIDEEGEVDDDPSQMTIETFEDGEEDLLGNLEKHLEGERARQ